MQEKHPELQALVSAMSAGPIAPGDNIGSSNRTLIMTTCRQDGVLLKPDRPAFPPGIMFLKRLRGAGEVQLTHSAVGAASWIFCLSFGMKRAVSLSLQELGIDASREHGVAWSRKEHQQFSLDSSTELLRYGPGKPALSLPMMPPQHGDSVSWGLYSYWRIAPTSCDGMGWTLLGELDKLVSVSSQRIASIATACGGAALGITVDITGAPGEAVTLSFLPPPSVGTKANLLLVKLTLSTDGTARAHCSKSSCTAQQEVAIQAPRQLQLKTDDVWWPERCVFSRNVSAPAKKSNSKEYYNAPLQLDLGYADTMVKVFPTDGFEAAPGCPEGEIMLRAARGQRVAFQLLLSPRERLAASVTVRVDGCASCSSSIFKVGYTEVNWAVDTSKNRTGPYPDILVPAAQSSDLRPLPIGQVQPYWVELAVPTNQTDEFYAFLTVAAISRSGAQNPVSLPVKVLVWGSKALQVPPAELASQSLEAKFNEELPLFLGPEQSVNNTQFDSACFENFHEQRVNKYVWMPVGGLTATLSADRTAIALDTAPFDRRVRWLLQAGGVTDIRFPVPSGSSEWMFSTIDGDWKQSHSQTMNASWTFGSGSDDNEQDLVTLPVFVGTNITDAKLNPEFVRLFMLVNNAILAHLKAQGWLNRTVAAFTDEPHFAAPEGELDQHLIAKGFTAAQLNNFTRWAVVSVAKLWKGLSPELRLQQTGDDPATLRDPDMQALVDIWVVNNQAYRVPGVPASLAALRRGRPSVVTTFYHNSIPVVDLPAIRVRSFPWQIWRTNFAYPATRRLGLSGSLSWYTNTRWKMAGGLDLYLSANAGPRGGCGDPADPCVDNAAGLANLLYPPVDSSSMVPVSSVRWNLLARGLEDVEYFVALDKLVTDELADGRTCAGPGIGNLKNDRKKSGTASATTSHDEHAAVACCALATMASDALDAVGEVVWEFADSKNLSSAPYSADIGLMHRVLDGVAAAIDRVESELEAGLVCRLRALHPINLRTDGSSASDAVERACGNATFPFPRDGVEVVGLRDAKGHAGRGSATACVAVCCTTPGCLIWQWNRNVSDGSHWHAACRVGAADEMTFASPGWVGGGKTAGPPVGPAPPPPPPRPPSPPPPIRRGLLSDALGSHMVLQRAPAAAVIWGFSPAGSTVKTTLDSRAPALTAAADAGGVWRQALPPAEAGGPHTIRVESSAGATAVLADVLFGDVYVCGGQSNMAFSMPGITNASHEASLADNYPTIRLFTVGQETPYQSGRQPLDNLLTVEQNWTVASSKSVAAPAAAGIQFGVFSAVCWIFGRTIHDGLGGKVPVGLVSSNWPGTRLEAWTPAPAFALCGRSAGSSNLLYNSMIHPLAVGPMALAGFTWYQVPLAAPAPPACPAFNPLLCCLPVSRCAPVCLLFAHPRHHATAVTADAAMTFPPPAASR